MRDQKTAPQVQAADPKALPTDRSANDSRQIALAIPTVAGGGAERAMLNLAAAFSARGHRVDLVVCRAKGELRNEVPNGVKLVELRRGTWTWSRLRVLAADPTGLVSLLRPPLLRYLPDLVRYLRRARPQVLLSALTNLNLVALWARRVAGVPTRLAVCEQNTVSHEVQAESNKRRGWRFFLPLIARTYPRADAIIAVSAGVADDLSIRARIPRERILTIHNPVVTPDLEEKSRLLCAHPWFASSSPPVVLAVGRLAAQKDFPTLLRAFARLRRLRPARLVVLGEGEERTRLEALAHELGIAADVALPGFVSNPYTYIGRAAVLALSSVYEGLPSVVIEALACGCPVVSTDCPSGPAEILDDGAYGALVPVGDDAAMADAIRATLDAPPERNRLRARAALFSAESKVEQYLRVLLG